MIRKTAAIFLALCIIFLPGSALPCIAAEDETVALEKISAAGSPPASEAMSLMLSGKEDDALKTLDNALHTKAAVPADVPYFLAAFEKQRENFDAAAAHLLQARTLYAKGQNLNDHQKMLMTKRLADCYYGSDKMKEALCEYNIALADAEKDPDGAISVPEIIESMVACEVALKRYDAAEKHVTTLVNICRSRLPKGGIFEFLTYAWSLFQKADLYRRTNQTEKMAEVRLELRPLLINLVESRMNAEANGQFPDYKTRVAEVRNMYVRAIKPSTPPELAWAASDFRVKTLPIVAWQNKTGKPIASVICIHGLGLENWSFAHFAARLNERGYMVYALDVRGFGSWTQTKGEENLDYTQTLADIRNLAEVVLQRNPGVPVYVLGESMGGAIAIRAGAQLGDVINGVISSVPSAERFQAKKMSLQTAMHFFVDPHKAFNIGNTVANLATSSEQARSAWKEDPKAKMGMTPIELMKFALFMRTTKPQAAKITKLPVFMVQGLQDQLVKPQGTFDLFDAVKSTDKTFLTIGNAEHLIFENRSPDPILMDSLDSWLRQHCVKETASK
ncbi:MAG: alpha/beta fold hydrolase [Cyanobacteria bacterium SZAS LIN-2]|nr:alpha/beta fold hydrolase [Cyanobacteria bacterium SZAS LIN-2]